LTEKRLDIFPHIFPQEFFERMKQIAGRNPSLAAALKRWMHIPVLWDLDKRIEMMQRWPGYQQVLTLSMPAIEFLGTPEETPALARLANDGMADIVKKYPDLFPAFAASLPMNNVPASLEEMDRAIGKLGAKGVFFYFRAERNGGKQHYWRYYDLKERAILDNRYLIANLIQCEPSTPRVVEATDLAYLGMVNGYPVYADKDDVADVIDELNDLNKAQQGRDLGEILNQQKDLREALNDVKVLYVPMTAIGCTFQAVQRQEEVRKGGNK